MASNINITNCAYIVEQLDWFDTKSLTLLLFLMFIDILVITGNLLVIVAIFSSPLLRSATNLFIISLAFADLMVGLTVLPFSAVWETYKIWIFGDLWCSFWLAIDVWMCTASILHLCAISMDRYLAVTQPIQYPNIMTSYKTKFIITFVWILSFLICFPPLLGWEDKNIEIFDNQTTSKSFEQNSTIERANDTQCLWKCELTNEAGYVVYSALGSFYIPMLVMLFFYWKIYRAAIRTTRAINQGFRTTKGFRNRNEKERLTLRIHRGRSAELTSEDFLKNHNIESNRKIRNDSNSKKKVNLKLLSTTKQKSISSNCIKICIKLPSDDNLNNSSTSLNDETNEQNSKDNDKIKTLKKESTTNEKYHLSANNFANPTKKRSKRKNLRIHAKIFRSETKAAKTLGIIVGGFILCWLPFFTMYLLRAFYPDVINPVMFSILFWLGYCNSALNPLIYAVFSRDFRSEFKKILFKLFFCKQLQNEQKLIVSYQLAKKTEVSRSFSNFSNYEKDQFEMQEMERFSK